MKEAGKRKEEELELALQKELRELPISKLEKKALFGHILNYGIFENMSGWDEGYETGKIDAGKLDKDVEKGRKA